MQDYADVARIQAFILPFFVLVVGGGVLVSGNHNHLLLNAGRCLSVMMECTHNISTINGKKFHFTANSPGVADLSVQLSSMFDRTTRVCIAQLVEKLFSARLQT